MNIIEKCEIEFQTGRKAGREEALPKFTTQEILEELVKRDGVSSVNTKHDDYYWITVSGKDGISDDPLRGIGEATIIVVRGKE